MKSRRSATFLAIMTALLLPCGVISGCGGSHVGNSGNSGNALTGSPTRLAPASLFGTWRLVRVGGGISGSGYPFQIGTSVTFTREGRVTTSKDGQQESSGTYKVLRTVPYRYYQSNRPVTRDIPVLEQSGRDVDLLIYEANEESLVLSESDVSDAFSYAYIRVK